LSASRYDERMKHLLRRVLMVLLALTVPLQAQAAVTAASQRNAQPCPMHTQATHEARQASPDERGNMRNCCATAHHQTQASDTGSCKFGHDCGGCSVTGSAVISLGEAINVAPNTAKMLHIHASSSPPPHISHGLWRPPTAHPTR
jgi:hypothetical protein